MGSRANIKNFADTVNDEGIIPRQAMIGNFPLARQNSIYSLTFDEFQNTWGGLRKDFGSMNMDELLKSISTAEESQMMNNNNNNNTNDISINNNSNSNGSLPIGFGGEGGPVFPGGNLQRQGSFTLPRTLSQKTVDEVWREFESGGVCGGGGGSGGVGSNVPQRQQTLGEMTLQEFLVRAGVVMEDPQPLERPNNYGFASNINGGLAENGTGLLCNNGFLSNDVGARPSRLPPQSQPLQTQPQFQLQQDTLFPKQTTLAFSSAMNMVNGSQPTTQGMRSSVVGIGERRMKNNLLQAVDFKTGVTVAAVSPGSQMSPDHLTPKSNIDTPSSPVPFVFGRGRRSGAAQEKVIERRQRRMIKNRESAARSRARKQAYTLELEAEIEKLKKLNQDLQRKQAEILEVQKNKLLEPMRQPLGCKRQCLRRTLTGPW